MIKKPIIALAPIRYFDKEKNDNLSKIKHHIQLAKKHKADIICFPESCLHRKDALDLSSHILKEIQEECKKNSIWCIVSDDIIFKKKMYAIALLINRNGKIVGHYKKINICEEYHDEILPGRQARVFNTDFGKIGIVLCWDLAYPKLFRRMKRMGAQIVFCPTWWVYEAAAHKRYKHSPVEQEIGLIRSLTSTRAFENLYFVAVCNPITDDPEDIEYTAIISPHQIVKESIEKEELVIAQLDLNEIKYLEKAYKSYFNLPTPK